MHLSSHNTVSLYPKSPTPAMPKAPTKKSMSSQADPLGSVSGNGDKKGLNPHEWDMLRVSSEFSKIVL